MTAMTSPSLDDLDVPRKELFEFDEDILNLDHMSPRSPESMTPESPSSSSTPDTPMSDSAAAATEANSPAQPAAEKKPVKKRRSWGQELPVPTTNLPPRKRAKTDAEKEQRRIERVLRNRAAAQSSRERKRKEVEALEENRNTLADENERLKENNKNLEDLCKLLNRRVEDAMEQTQWLLGMLKSRSWTCASCKKEPKPEFHTSMLSPPLSITNDPSSPLSLPSEPASPPKSDGTLDPSQLSAPSDSDEDPFGSTQLTADKLCDLQCRPKTGPFSENQLGVRVVGSTVTRWTALATTVLMTLFLMISSHSMSPMNLVLALPILLLISSWISNNLTQRLGREPLTISLPCALPLDATSVAPWFECTFGTPEQDLFVSRNGSRGFVKQSIPDNWELDWRHYGKMGSLAGRFIRVANGMIQRRGYSLMAFDFSLLSFQGIG